MKQFKFMKSGAVTAAATTLFLSLCGSAIAREDTDHDSDPIEGVWESNVTVTDCASNAVLRSFKGVGLFQRGGALTADNSLPRLTQSIALGHWKRDDVHAYTANFRLFRFNLDGSLAGSQKVHRSLILAADKNSFSGTITAQVMDTAEVVLLTTCGSETAVRIY
jgi:hypothetical protein